MADEQSETLSQGAQSTDAGPQAESSESTGEAPSKAPAWWQKMFNRGREEPADDQEAKADEAASKPLSLTQEELDRRVQAETDRREAKRQAEARAAERKRLRDQDPWEYAKQERDEEAQAVQQQNWQGFFSDIGASHDRVSIDPVMDALPTAERERILKLEGAGRGVDGRKLIVGEALKALEKHWRAEGTKDAEARLRRNQAFRKQVLAESRDGTVEPDLIAGTTSSQADKTVSDLLRRHYRLG